MPPAPCGSAMHVSPFTSVTRTEYPAAFAASRLWNRPVASAATAVMECSSPADASEIAVNETAVAAATSDRASATRFRVLISRPPSTVEIRIEYAYLRDVIDRKIVVSRRLANLLGAGPVVDAEGLRPVFADVRVNPGHAFAGIPAHDSAAELLTLGPGRNVQALREHPLDHVTRHLALLSFAPLPGNDARRPACARASAELRRLRRGATYLARRRRGVRPSRLHPRACSPPACGRRPRRG